MPEDTASDPWYGHDRTPGHRQWTNQDVHLLPRQGRAKTREYRHTVKGIVESLWPSDKWFAPEAHKGVDPGRSWHWDELHSWNADKDTGSIWVTSFVPVPNDFKFVEAKYREDIPTNMNNWLTPPTGHGGMGWQWPLLIVYPEGHTITPQDFTAMERYGVPYYVLGEEMPEQPDVPMDPEPEQVEFPGYPDKPKGVSTRNRLKRLENKIDWVASLLLYFATRGGD